MRNGRRQQRVDLAALEATLHEAFSYATASRQAHGAGKPDPHERVVQSGPRAGMGKIGPDKYKMTVWLYPWQYVDLLRDREAHGDTMAPAEWLKKRSFERIPAYAARPAPRAERIGLRYRERPPARGRHVRSAAA